MKISICLVLSLIFISQCSEITKLYRDSLTTLSTSSKSNYFYLEKSDYDYSDIYLYFQDYSFYMDSYNLKICYTDNFPNTDMINTCSWTYKSPYYTYSSYSYSEYYYSLTKKSYYYIIVNYQGSSTYGSLYAESSDNDLANLVDAVISTVALVFIIIGSIIFFGIVITVIVFCCLCARKRTIQGSAGYVPPQQTYVVSNPVAYPQTGYQQPYPGEQPATPLVNTGY